MMNSARTKFLVVSVLFAGLTLAGIGLLAKQGVEAEVSDVSTSLTDQPTSDSGTPGETSTEESSSGTSGMGYSGTGKSDLDANEAGDSGPEGARKGPPSLFPTLASGPLTSSDYLRAFTALYKESAELFQQRAHQALAGPYPLEAQKAALQVWYQWNYEDRLSPFRSLLIDETSDTSASTTDTFAGTRDTQATSGQQKQELRGFAVDLLAKNAHQAAQSRELLADYIESKPADPSLRRQAWSSVLRWGRIKEIHRSLSDLYAERDPDCIQAAAEALQQTRESGSKAILRELSKRHPYKAARKQFKQLLSQR